jgi:hypothetical protein|tara:strand:+ start:452 stop:631 length:180 start_codon:yes stop_codon:yes gene_type:complete
MISRIFGLVVTCGIIGVSGAIAGASVSSFRHYAGWDENTDEELTEIKEIKKSKVKGGKK